MDKSHVEFKKAHYRTVELKSSLRGRSGRIKYLELRAYLEMTRYTIGL